jgi:hypothetical protein
MVGTVQSPKRWVFCQNFMQLMSQGHFLILIKFCVIDHINTIIRKEGLCLIFSAMSHQEESQSTPALIHIPEGYDPDAPSTSLGIIPENNLLESYTRLSISLEENGLFKVIQPYRGEGR